MTSQPTLTLPNTFVPALAALPILSITATAAAKPEGQSGVTAFTFTVKRTTSATASSVSWSVIHGSTSRFDFDGWTSGVLNFAATELSRTITVYAVGDSLAESNETFSIQLSDPVNATLGTASASSTITNDDKPRLSIAASVPSVSEGTSSDSTPYSFTVTRDVGSGASTVKWAVAHRSTNAQDFVGATSGMLSFADGDTTKVITVNVAAEAVVEGDESFVVQLSAPTSAMLATASAAASATILNDDTHTLSISAATPSKREGTTAATAPTPFTFTVQRSAGVGASSVQWDVDHLTTTEADFSGATSGTLNFAAGETLKTITVNVVGDRSMEADETFNVRLSTPANATIVKDAASATIVNDDLPSLSIAASSASLTEGSLGPNNDTVFTFTVTRSSNIGVSSADWTLQHRTTTALDFVGPTKGAVVFLDGQKTQTIQVRVAADTVIEADEVFAVQLSAPDGATLDVAAATATILNDDLPTLSIAPPTVARVKEGNTGTTTVTFTITRSSKQGSASATWNVVHGTTSASDFSGSTSGTVTFANNQDRQTVTVKLVGDTVYEADETFSVVLSQAKGARIVTAAAPITLLNDDPAPPLLQIKATPSASQPEGTLAGGSTTPFTFTVTRDTSVGVSSVNWVVVHRETNAQDFNGALSGTVDFANGETTKIITLQVAAEAVVELDQSFVVELRDPVNARLITETASVTATIVNDDVHVIGLVASSTRQPEGNSGTTPITFTVTRTAGVGASSVTWAIEHSTTSAADFSGPTSGIVEFASGETSRTITVNVIGDTALEADEAFSVRLSNPVGAQLASNAAVAFTIANDDTLPPPVLDITIGTPSQREGYPRPAVVANANAIVIEDPTYGSITAFTFNVTRSSDRGATSATWTVRPGTANADDFEGPTTGVVSFAAGETSKAITVNVIGDRTIERDETFSVQLSDPVGATLGTASAAATIVNDDLPVLTITSASNSQQEGNTGSTPFSYTVTRDSGIGVSSVQYYADLSARDSASADDFSSPLSGLITFNEGETSQVVTIEVMGDTTTEADELIDFYIHNPVNASLVQNPGELISLTKRSSNPDGSSTYTDIGVYRYIRNDDDLPTLSIAAVTASQAEGNTGSTAFTFDVTRSSGIGAAATTWTVLPGTAGTADFSGTTTGTVNFAAGETSKTITVNVVGDTTIEAAETFSVQLSDPVGAAIGSANATATILNDDLPTLTLTESRVAIEGNTISYQITRNSDIGISHVSYHVETKEAIGPFTLDVLQTYGIDTQPIDADNPLVVSMADFYRYQTASADDFTGDISGQVTFSDGEVSKVVTINLANDSVPEANELFRFYLHDLQGATLETLKPDPDNPLFWHSVPGDTPLWRRVVIRDNDPRALHIAANQTRQIEGTGGTTPFTFTITRDSGIGPQEVLWSRLNGPANDADFIGPDSGIVHFANGETSQTITINVVGDSTIEADETFRVVVHSSLLNWDIDPPIATATIANDDTAIPTLSIAATNATRAEGDSGTTPFTFTVTRSSDLGTASATWTVQLGTANASDFSGDTTGIVTFAAGQTSQTVTVNVVGDMMAEASETFSVQLSDPVGATLGTASAAATILNDDLPVIITTNPYNTREGSSVSYQVIRSSGVGTSSVRYHVETEDALSGPLDILTAYGLGTAWPQATDTFTEQAAFFRHITASANDFVGSTSGQITFNEGETSKVITLDIADDATPEATEYFRLYLDNPEGATLMSWSDTGFWNSSPSPTLQWSRLAIVNDARPTLSITANPSSQPEGDSGTTPFTFTVTRDSATGPQMVQWTRFGAGVSDADFSGPSTGVARFADGETSTTITIGVTGDTAIEPNETFRVIVWDGTASEFSIGATATILDDDTPSSPPTLSIAATNATRAEGDSGTTPFTFTVTRSHGVGESSVGYQVNPFGATADDFAPGTLSGDVRFADGETTQVITVNVLGDTVVEGDEMFLINLGGPVNATIDVSSTQGTILNDDTMSSPNFAGSLVSSPVATEFVEAATALYGAAAASTILTAASGRPTDFGLVATAA